MVWDRTHALSLLIIILTFVCCIYTWVKNDPHWISKFKSRRKVIYPTLLITLLVIVIKPDTSWESLENYYVSETYRSIVHQNYVTDFDTLTKHRLSLTPIKKAALPPLRPNILFFRLEEIAKSQFGLYDAKLGTTPFLSALLHNQPKELFTFQNHYSNSGSTDTSVVMIYTGLNPTRSGKEFSYFPVMWDYANAAGYHTFAVIPYPISWSDLDRKFASKEGRLTLDYIMSSDDPDAKIAYEDVISDQDITRYTLKQLESLDPQQPFFGIVDFYLPHGRAYPVGIYGYENLSCKNSPKKLTDYQCAIYDNDHQISLIFEKLKTLGRLDNTIIIGTSDHGSDIAQMGSELGSIRRVRLNNHYQEVMSIPLFIYIPQSIQGYLEKSYPEFKGNFNKQTSNIDLLPTIIDLLGIGQHPQIHVLLQQIDGKSLLRELPDTRWIEAKNTNDFRTWEPEGFALLYNNQYKYILDDSKESIYDLKADIEEKYNLYPPSMPAIENFYQKVIDYIHHNDDLKQLYGKNLNLTSFFKKISAAELPTHTGLVIGKTLAATVTGMLTYGPYEKLKNGQYEIKINYKTPRTKQGNPVGSWDAGYFSLEEPIKLAQGPIDAVTKRGHITFKIEVPPALTFEPFEIRTFYNGTGNIIIESIHIKGIP